MIFYCVRHGESVYNHVGRIQGWLDIPLSPLGERQAAAAGRALAKHAIERVFASPLQRAFQTAEAVTTALSEVAALRLSVEPRERLKEIQVGDFQGQLGREVAQKYPEIWSRWTSCDPDFALPGGETRRHLAERCVAELREIATLPHREVAIVSHGAILTVALKTLAGIPLDQPPYALQNGSITTMELFPDGRYRLIDRDNVEHLATVGTSGNGDLPV